MSKERYQSITASTTRTTTKIRKQKWEKNKCRDILKEKQWILHTTRPANGYEKKP